MRTKRKFKSRAWPDESPGQSYLKEKVQVQPNQSMSLQEILERFTRNEALPIGREVSYHESDDDLEKISKMDLVDKAEFVDSLKETKQRFDDQEKRKKDAYEAKLKAEIEEKLRLEQAQKQSSQDGNAK